MDLTPHHWHYLNEGNKHLLLSYKGTHDNLMGKVIRLKKREE